MNITLLDIIVAILLMCMVGGCVMTFKSCTDHLSNNKNIEYCMKG